MCAHHSRVQPLHMWRAHGLLPPTLGTVLLLQHSVAKRYERGKRGEDVAYIGI